LTKQRLDDMMINASNYEAPFFTRFFKTREP